MRTDKKSAVTARPGSSLEDLALAKPCRLHLEAARAAFGKGRHHLASQLYAKAYLHRPLREDDRLAQAEATLVAAEKMRKPRGRNGAWARHEDWLRCAADLFEEAARTGVDPTNLRRAWNGLVRSLRLLEREDSARIDAVTELAKLADG
jgi:hypothetical protein